MNETGDKRMDLATLIGMVLGILSIGVGMVLKGVPVSALANPAAFLDYYHGEQLLL